MSARLGSACLLWGEIGPPYWQTRLEDLLGSARLSYCCGLFRHKLPTSAPKAQLRPQAEVDAGALNH